jgi:hypothetical protein
MENIANNSRNLVDRFLVYATTLYPNRNINKYDVS